MIDDTYRRLCFSQAWEPPLVGINSDLRSSNRTGISQVTVPQVMNIPLTWARYISTGFSVSSDSDTGSSGRCRCSSSSFVVFSLAFRFVQSLLETQANNSWSNSAPIRPFDSGMRLQPSTSLNIFRTDVTTLFP